ncbi:MAG TPA: hypothetical protein VLG50_02570 [Candidatus Saccharimonadales bacterium]|nr:hypothetical protein [Candidatus Saccharimonadales bacterium]
MHTKKITLTVLSCLFFVHSFQISASETAKNNRKSHRGMEMKTILTAGLVFMGLSLCATETDAGSFYTNSDYSRDIESCLDSGGSFNCLDVRSGNRQAEAKVFQTQSALTRKTRDCMVNEGVSELRQWWLFTWLSSTCDMQQKECQDRFEQVEKECTRRIVDSSFKQEQLAIQEQKRLWAEEQRLQRLGREWNHYKYTYTKEMEPCLTYNCSFDCLNGGQTTSDIQPQVIQVQQDLQKNALACMKDNFDECHIPSFWSIEYWLSSASAREKECKNERKIAEKLCVMYADSKFKELASKYGYEYKG